MELSVRLFVVFKEYTVDEGQNIATIRNRILDECQYDKTIKQITNILPVSGLDLEDSPSSDQNFGPRAATGIPPG